MGGGPATIRAKRSALPVVLCAAVLATLLPPQVEARSEGPAERRTRRPSVVVIVADDMRWDEAGVKTALRERFPPGYLPTIRGALVDKGFTARNAFVVNSLCCPSRASILTGNYSHTTRVWNNQNQLGRGGFVSFKRHEDSTMATWFHRAGYRTAFVGKYMNGYNATSHVPRGWDRWVAFDASTVGYYDYRLTVNGSIRSYGSSPSHYSTDVLADHATGFISSTPATKPLFLMFAPYTPHAPFTPAPRHASLFGSYVPKMPPNFGERNLSDKPSWLRSRPAGAARWALKKRDQMRMLMALDEAVAGILDSLRAEGRLRDAIIVFMSDNGLSGGSHRWVTKKSAWDEAIRIPLIVRGPGIPHGIRGKQLMLNIDVAETLGKLAGVRMPRTDGRSLVRQLRGASQPVRKLFAIERLVDTGRPPSYCAVRSRRYKYIRYANGEQELYDLRKDPWEMSSRHRSKAHASIEARLRRRAKAICSPPPPGYRF
jgi:arylsulfatase A-like enzyme